MALVDAQLRMVQINPLARPSFQGIDPLLGRSLDEIMDIIWGPEVGPNVVAPFRHTLETGEIYVAPTFVNDRRDLGVEKAYDWQTQRVTLPNGEYAVVC